MERGCSFGTLNRRLQTVCNKDAKVLSSLVLDMMWVPEWWPPAVWFIFKSQPPLTLFARNQYPIAHIKDWDYLFFCINEFIYCNSV